MTVSQLRNLLPYWQEQLNLNNWTITVQRGTRSQLRKKDENGEWFECDGYNHWSTEQELSQILLARGQGEETLVHELLHLVFDDHLPFMDYDPFHERGLNRVAKALVTLRLSGESNLQKVR